MPRFPMALTAAAVLGAALLGAQQSPTFRAGTNTVSVYATVTEKEGRLSPYLEGNDFSVYDNGQQQPLTVFSNDVQPITVVVMLDRSGSMSMNFDLERDAAQTFVGRLLPKDKARLGSFADEIRLDPPEFTSDQEQLKKILTEDLQAAGMTPLWNATGEAMTALSHEPGRRVLLIFTDGTDNPGPAVTTEKKLTLKQVEDRAQAVETMVYVVGLSACGAPAAKTGGDAEPALEIQGRGRRGAPPPIIGGTRGGPPGGRGGRGGARGGAPGGGAPCAAKNPDGNLQRLADDSGGRYLSLDHNTSLATTFARVADELHRQYVLGFTAPKLDGKVHKIDVRVREPELLVRARQNYLAPSSGSGR